MRRSLGSLVARFLAGSWRRHPPPLECTVEELKRVAPLLLGSGAGALAWRRIRDSELSQTPIAKGLEEQYRWLTLSAGVDELGIKQVIRLLDSAGVNTLLVKGWACARLYPEPGLRPYGDLDLCIPPEQDAVACKVLESPEVARYEVDLHIAGSQDPGGLPRAGQDDLTELQGRSQSLNLDGVEIRIPSQEDHLRILCLHLLKHNAARPLWLCDIAVAVESRDANFDWDLCLGSDPVQADWVACAIGLAHQILGAEVKDTPVAERAQDLPQWLVRTVLRKWWTWRNPSWQFEVIRRRLDIPIQSALHAGTHFDRKAWIFVRSIPYQGLPLIPSLGRQTARLVRSTLGRLIHGRSD